MPTNNGKISPRDHYEDVPVRPASGLRPGVTAIILTFNEEKHIERCITKLKDVADRICVVDSISTDSTVSIVHRLGKEVFINPWKNYSSQFTWALQNLEIDTEWILRIDADEYFDELLTREVIEFTRKSPASFNSAYLRRKLVFLGRPIIHGFFYPAMMLRLWRTGQGEIEQRWMDEHITVKNPATAYLKGDLIDHNINDLSWWANKHIGYATREVYDLVETEAKKSSSAAPPLSGNAKLKRYLKTKLYAKLPYAARGSLYFTYRYLFGLGFLDGMPGFYFHFLQAFWYRVFVDAKLYELRLEALKEGLTAYDFLKQKGVFRY